MTITVSDDVMRDLVAKSILDGMSDEARDKLGSAIAEGFRKSFGDRY